MRVDFLVESRDDPSARHRVLDLQDPLAGRGLRPRVVELPPDRRARRAAFRSLAEAEVVVLQRRLMNRFDLRALRRACRRLVFDFDDALPYRDTSRGAGLSRTRARRFRCIVTRCDLVVAGNSYLADLAREFGAREAIVVPTGLDMNTYPMREDPGAGTGERLGWIGSRSTLPYLEELAEPLRRAAAERPGLLLRVLCDACPDLPGVPLEFVPWRKELEVPFLHSLDIGLAPVPDDPWTRGKCGLRLLKYMACGVAALASPVGVQEDLVEPDTTGRIAPTPEAWKAGILDLAGDRDQRVRLARGAREAVADGYHTVALARRLEEAFSGLAAS